MQAIKCELCGSSDIMKQDGFFQCLNCKTKYSIEEARNLIGVVKIDKSEDVENLLILARRYFNTQNYSESEKYYELALRDAPNNWEAVYYHAYCQALHPNYDHPEEALNTILNGTKIALELIPEQLEPEQQHDALRSMIELNQPIVCQRIDAIRQIGLTGHGKNDQYIHQTIRLYEFLENLIRQNFAEDHEMLKVALQTRYDIIKRNPDAFKWGERRKMLKRLKTELGK